MSGVNANNCSCQLALEFVSRIDDISFQLAKLDVLGKTLRNATSSKSFWAEFERKPYAFRKKMTIFAKFLYAFILLFLLASITAVGIYQQRGHFQCSSITLTFGDDVWENAWVKGKEDRMVLVYSYFNGLYEKVGMHDRRPLYRERRKSDGGPFQTKIGAEIKYCESENAWVFTHEMIRKTKTSGNSSCPWLLRSPNTDEFDLLDVPHTWEIWVGVIDNEAQMSVACNECRDDTDCNLNGVCTDKECVCTNPDYAGRHCELELPCARIISDLSNETWSVVTTKNCETFVHEYERPIYTLLGERNITGDIAIPETLQSLNEQLREDMKYDLLGDRLSIIYTGSRWFVMVIEGGKKMSMDMLEGMGSEFHAFWDR